MRAEKIGFQKLPVIFHDFKDRMALSDCVIAGGTDLLLIFLDIYIYFYSMILPYIERTSESAFFMFCVWQFAVRSKRLSYRILTNQGRIITMATDIYSSIDQRVGQVAIAGTGKHASIFMQYARINSFLHSYDDACPRDKRKANNYMPGVSEGYMNGTLDRFGKRKVRSAREEEDED
jgi:hypothetical protein